MNGDPLQRRGLRRGQLDFGVEEVADDLLLERLLEGLEGGKGLCLELDQRIPLAHRLPTDVVLEVLQSGEVVRPALIDQLQHQLGLGDPHHLLRVERLLLRVEALRLLAQSVSHLLGAVPELLQFDLLRRRKGKDVAQAVPQTFQVPLGLVAPGAVDGDQVPDHLLGPLVEVVAGVHTLQDPIPLRVDDRTLHVDHVIEFDNVPAAVEVGSLDPRLRGLDLAAHQPRLNGDVLVDPKRRHQPPHPLPPEDPHQVVFEGEKEPALAGVALAAGPAPQLVVDAP